MALGTVHPLPGDGTDPHVVISFEPEPDTLGSPGFHSQRAEQASDLEGFVFEDEGFDCRVGNKRRHEVAMAAEKAAADGRQAGAKAAADGGRVGSAARKGRPPGKGEREKAAKPAGPLPKGWRCISKVHASGQREGQRYKARMLLLKDSAQGLPHIAILVYISPGGKQYLSYASAQADFAGKLPPKPAPPPAPAQPQGQPRRAEYLPPDWAVVKGRDGLKTFVGPAGQRISSWHGLLEELADADVAGRSTQSQEPQAQEQKQHPGSGAQPPPAAPGGAVARAEVQASEDGVAQSLAAWLRRLAREVQHEQNDLTAKEQMLARQAMRLRLVRLRHE